MLPLSSDKFPWLAALLLGDTGGLSAESIWQSQLLGITHIFSPSGFHANFFLLLAIKNKWLRRLPAAYRYLALFITIMALLGLGNICGWPKPYLRACIFSLCGYLCLHIGLKISIETCLGIACIFAWYGGTGSSLSWLLSTLGMLGIIFAKKYWQQLLFPWITSMPIIAWKFGLISPLAPLANAILCPMLGLLALPLGLVGIFLPQKLQSPLFSLLEWCCEKFSLGIQFFSTSMPAFWFPAWLWPQTILLSICLYLFVFYRQKNIHFIKLPVIASCLFLLFYAFKIQSPWGAWILDIGQGDAIVLKNNNSGAWLVDTGSAYKKFSPLPLQLAAIGINDFSGLILTHPDADHSGGLTDFLMRYQKEELAIWLHPGWLSLPQSQKILAQIEAKGIKIQFLRAHQKLNNHLECAAAFSSLVKATNDFSPLCRFGLPSKKSLLLTGDMSAKMEKYWLKNSPFPLAADFLKVAHHGSESSSDPAFIAAVRPETAVISVGRQNLYQHPHGNVLERLWSGGMLVRRTDSEGTIYLR